MIRHKFNAVRVERNGWSYPSKKQARRYDELVLLKTSGEVIFFIEEVPFRLPGKTKYVVDFVVFWKGGDVTFEDVKGFKTQMYKLKKRQVESLFPIKITEQF